MATKGTKRDTRPALHFRVSPAEAAALDVIGKALGDRGRATVARRILQWAIPRLKDDPSEVFRKVPSCRDVKRARRGRVGGL